jgi:threonine dehydrogenase-like Zn-dependent dehydrogenase
MPRTCTTHGTVVVAGLTGNREVPLRTDQLAWKELRWQGVFACEGEHLVRALRLIATRRYPFGRMISHRFPLDEAQAALSLVGGGVDENDQPVKVVLSANR